MGQFTLSFDAFRFFEDGAESSSVGLVNQGINIGFDLAADFNFQLRVRLQESGGKSGATSDDFRLQYRKNGGTWTNVTTTSSNVKGFDSSDLTDGGATTNRLSGGSGSFVAGKISETGEVVDHQLTANNYTEHLYSLTLISADIALDDKIEFRVLLNGSTFTYNVVPKFTRINLPPGQPTLYTEDEAEFSTGRPSLEFSVVDPEGDDVTYELRIFKKAPVYAYIGGTANTQTFLPIEKVDITDMSLDKSLVYGARIDKIVMDDSYLYVGGWKSEDQLWKVDKFNLTKSQGMDCGGSILDMALDGENLYVLTNAEEILLIDVTAWSIEERRSFSHTVNQILVDENNLYVTGRTSSTHDHYLKLNKTTLATVSSFDVSVGSASSPSIAQDDNFVYSVVRTAAEAASLRRITKSTWSTDQNVDPGYTSVSAVSIWGDYFYVWESRTLHRHLKSNLSSSDSYPKTVEDMFLPTFFLIREGDAFAARAPLQEIDKVTWDLVGPSHNYHGGATGAVIYTVALDEGLDLALEAKSSESAGFENVDNPLDIDPFNSGDKIRYTVPEEDALVEDEYVWQVRGKDV